MVQFELVVPVLPLPDTRADQLPGAHCRARWSPRSPRRAPPPGRKQQHRMAQESRAGRVPGELSATAAARALHRTVVGDQAQRQAVAGAMHDAVTRIEQRHTFLAQLGVIAASAPDAATLAASVAALVLPDHADWCIIEVLEPGGTRRCLASAHVDPERAEAAAARLGTVDGAEDGSPLASVLRTGKPVIGILAD